MIQLKNIVVISFVFILTFFAQDTLAQRGQRGNIVEHLKHHIELTPEQETELTAITEKYNTRIKSLREDPSENREKIKQLRQAQRAEVNKVLTAEQEATLKEKRKGHHGHRKGKGAQGDKKGLRTELKKYREENIKPVLAAQRVQLENKISGADRATLAELRVVFEQEKTARKSSHKKGERPDREARDAQRDAFEMKYAKEIATLKSLTQKYDTELENIRTAIQPQIEKWKKDTQAITQKYLSESEDRKGHHAKKKHHKSGAILKGEKAKSRFLLMAPAA
ncbi:MAG: hypothetical protein AB8G22_23855 [Saprospiraceae bacterium]